VFVYQPNQILGMTNLAVTVMFVGVHE